MSKSISLRSPPTKQVSTFTANVEYKPVVSISQLEGDMHRAIEDKDVTLTCTVAANPPATKIEWKNSEGAIKSSSGSLTLSKVKLADAGEYVCEATNTRGVGTGKATLDVLYRPKITLAATHEFVEGDAAAVECVVDSNPPPSRIMWLKSQSVVASGAWLNFTSVDRKNASDYACSSSNVMIPTDGMREESNSEKGTKVFLTSTVGSNKWFNHT